ncbi:hypothetical protein [Candidatus Binatus sp.]|uniref:hypothetical protein n=1 Tax=Candidatus Binatus sp. TaxID=2811406 RepID=UPI003BB1C3EC
MNAQDLTDTDMYTITYTFTLVPIGGGTDDIIMGTVPLTPLSPTCLPPNGDQPDCVNSQMIPIAGAPTGNWLVTGVVTAEDTTNSTPVFCADTEIGGTGFDCIVDPLNGIMSPVNGTPTPAELDCPATTGGCPATFGFWKNKNGKHPFPATIQADGLTIGGVLYSAADLHTILNNPGGGNAVTILGVQLVAALVNKAAGALDNPLADAAITDAETALSSNSLNLQTSNVKPSSPLGQELLADETVLNGYNNSNFGTCSEGSGLTL